MRGARCRAPDGVSPTLATWSRTTSAHASSSHGASIAAAASEVILTKLPKQAKDTGGAVVRDRSRRTHRDALQHGSGMYRGWVDQTGAVRIAIFVE